MKSEIISYAKSLGITEAGIAGDGESWSAVVCLFPYFSGVREGADLSVYAYSLDYHKIVDTYLEKIEKFIQGLSPHAKTSRHVDTGAPRDKELAHMAGLGFYGRNSLIINEKYGSFAFIGYVMTDLALPSDAPLDKTCASCGACQAACPGSAISENGFCAEKCASKISQTKGELTKEQQDILKKSGYIWGCDICQNVCPHNKNVRHTNLLPFTENLVFTLSKDELESLSDQEFKQKYGNRAFSWRGRATILRNSKILSVLKRKK